jgi:acetoin utilization protein AcuB
VTTLSIYEVTTLLYKVTGKDVMRTGVITVDADAALTEAAEQMLAHKVSGLPVMRDGRLVGIITESDIFRAVVGHSLALPAVEAAVTAEGQTPPRTVLPIV